MDLTPQRDRPAGIVVENVSLYEDTELQHVAKETAPVVTTVKTPVEALDLDEDSVFGDGEVFQ